MANIKMFTKSMGTQHKTDIAQGNSYWLDSRVVQDTVLFSTFLISSFQAFCEVQNRGNWAPVIYIVLNKKKRIVLTWNRNSFVSKCLMREDASVHLPIHHLLHINEYPIMPILTKKQLTESVNAQTELLLSPCIHNTKPSPPGNRNSVWHKLYVFITSDVL